MKKLIADFLRLIVAFGWWAGAVQAQDRLSFQHLSTADGLSQSSVIAIAQDQFGLLWFGTRDGLNRYDGEHFTVYRNRPGDSTSISNNDILKILVDRHGDLWIGTYNGLSRYSYREDRFYTFFNEKENPGSLANNSVWTLEEMANGEIWIGTGAGINVYKDGTMTRLRSGTDEATSLTGLYITELFQDAAGHIWVGTSRGLNRVLEITEQGVLRVQRYTTTSGHLLDNFIQTIAQASDSSLWIGTRGGLHRLSPGSGTIAEFASEPGNPQSLSHSDVRSLSFDPEGVLWVGTYSGLNRMTETGVFHRFQNDLNDPKSLRRNTVKSTFIDEKGSLWVGMYYGGISMLDKANDNFHNLKRLAGGNGLSYDVVSTIVEDAGGTVYVGTEGGGINVLTAGDRAIHVMKTDRAGKSFSSNNIKAMHLVGDQLWIGTYNRGVDVYDIGSGRITAHFDKAHGLHHNSVYALLASGEHHIWVGTFGGGLHLLDVHQAQSVVLTHDPADMESLSDNQVRLLHRDSRGNLWVGTQYGLNLLRKSDWELGEYRFQRFFYDYSRKSGEDILVIFEDSQQRLWVGTYESGLSLYQEESGRFVAQEVFAETEEASNVVHGILEDDAGNLWLSSNHGIIRYHPATGERLTFDASDGLVSNEFNNNASFRSALTGKMYFGGPEGLSIFRPRDIRTNTHVAPAVITGLKLLNQPVKVGAADGILRQSLTSTHEITLDYDQAIFTLEFSAPHFFNPHKNQYAFRLLGLENNWNITENNAATYTIQQPGTYVFEVKSANSDNLWSDEVTTLAIKVLPAPWRTWWAFLGYFLMVVLALWLLVRINQSKARLRHQLELEHLEYERQQAVNKMKLQFFTNISHEFRTPLTLILGPLEQILSDYRGSNKMFKQLKVIEKNGLRLMKLINQLMDFRKFENQHEKLHAAEGNMVKFVEEIFLSFRQYAKQHRIDYELVRQSETIPVYYDRDKMERVFYNLLANAFKYTPSGSIRVAVGEEEGQFVFRISDTGIGIEKAQLERIFDRFYEVQDGSAHQTSAFVQHAGTGIGLAIVREVVTLHRGQIAVASEPGQGTTFTVRLPLGRAHLKDEELIPDFRDSEDIQTYLTYNQENAGGAALPAEMTVNADLENAPCLLIVEDNPSVRRFIVDVFAGSYRVEEAENGLEGLRKALSIVPDIILSDVMMPEMDGIELCTQVKSNLKTSHIPFVLLTARTSLIFKFEGLESGADEYIGKPFNIRELSLKVKNMLAATERMKQKFSGEAMVNPSEITVSSMDEKLLKSALKIVEDHIADEFFNVSVFSNELGVSRTMLFTKIKAWTNLTPNEFVHSMRMKRAAQLLELNKLSVAEVSYRVGFSNPKYFSKCFQKYHSYTPSEYAEKFTVVPVERAKVG